MFSSATYRVKRILKWPMKPLFINFPVTYKCNAKCTMCDIWKKYSNNNKENNRTVDEELTAKDIADFVQKNKEFLSNLRSIGFTGGEAFLRKDIVDIVKVVHEGLPWVDVGIQTNGLLPELIKERVSEIIRFNPDFKIAVSLDGIGNTHDEIRGVKGAFEKAVRTIEYAKELGITGITCGMTLTSRNYDQISKVAKRVESLGCEFSCFLPEKSEYFGNEDRNYEITREQLNVIAEELEDFSCHYFMDNLRLQILGKAKRTLPCYSGYTSYVIDPYGEVHPCILRGESFGNIRDGLLEDTISSKRAWELRKKLKSCSCWCQCEVSSSAIVAPFDVLKWFSRNKNKKMVLETINKKILLNRL